jgi:hypothetical protein
VGQEHGPVATRQIAEIEEGMPGYKDGGTATILSLLITGGGQFCAGETGAGALYLVGSIAAVGIGAGASNWDRGDYESLYAGAGVATVLWLVGCFTGDAPSQPKTGSQAGRPRVT